MAGRIPACDEAALRPIPSSRLRLLSRAPTLLAVLVLALTAAGCVEWPMFRHDSKHTAQSSFNTGFVRGVLEWKFSFPKGCAISSSPAVDTNERIYIGAVCGTGANQTGGFCAINPDGTSAWCALNLHGYPMRSSAAVGSAVYVGGFDSGTAGLMAIDPGTGNVIWNFPSAALISPPTLSTVLAADTGSFETTIYVGSFDGKLYAVNANGTEKWHLALGTTSVPVVSSSPAVAADGTVYVGFTFPTIVGEEPTGGLEAANPDGTEKWIFGAAGVDSSPAVGGDGTIYFGSYDQFFHAVNPNGTAKWSLANVGVIVSSPGFAPGGGTIYFGSRDHRLYAVDPSALLKFVFTTGGNVDSSPAISNDGTIYVGSSDHYVYAIDPNGKLKWKFLTGGAVRSSPAVSSRAIYVGSDDGSLYAIQ